MFRGTYVAVMGLALMVGCATSGNVSKRAPVVDLKPRTPKPSEARKKVAVCEFVNKSQYGKGDLGAPAADILTNYLVKSQQFRVFERQQLKHVLDEQKLGQSGIVDPNTAAQVGKVMGVEYVVYGVISNFGQRVETSNIIIHQSKSLIAECQVDVRMVNVTTSEIVYSMDGRGQADRTASGSMGLGGGMSFDPALAQDSLRAAIVEMMDALIDAAD